MEKFKLYQVELITSQVLTSVLVVFLGILLVIVCLYIFSYYWDKHLVSEEVHIESILASCLYYSVDEIAAATKLQKEIVEKILDRFRSRNLLMEAQVGGVWKVRLKEAPDGPNNLNPWRFGPFI